MGSSPSKPSPYAEQNRRREINFVNRNRTHIRPSHRAPDRNFRDDPLNTDNKYLHQPLPRPPPPPPPPPPTKTVDKETRELYTTTQPKKQANDRQPNKDKNMYKTQNGKLKTSTVSTPPKKKGATDNKKSKKGPNTVKISVDSVDSRRKPAAANSKTATKFTPRPQPTPRKNVITPRTEETPRHRVPASRGGNSQESYRAEEDEDDEEYEYMEEEEEYHPMTEKEKIESHLRSSRVPETKVRTLAVRISEETKKAEQLHTQRDSNADVTKTLRRVINKNLDTMLYGTPRKTKLRNNEDESTLAHKVSEMAELLESDLTMCLDSAQYGPGGKSNQGKSMPLVIQSAIQQLKADYEILLQEHGQLREEKYQAERANLEGRHKTEALQESSFQVEFQYQKLQDDHHRLKEQVSALAAEERTLRLTLQDLDQENTSLQRQVDSLEESNRTLSKELDKSQDTCAHLTVQVADQAKEIARLKDPDPEMVYKINALQSELTESKTANRKLELEKGTIKSNLQKLQANYNALLKERGILSKENQKLQKENDLMKTTNKKLVLASQILR